ncbi:MAG: ribosomal protein S18-alanine N-acetyltransferase [Pyrinomonadaceae bacterium]|nr:ribosomal protein S18-alanine N-acetyltransferase [Pyrinomonadaceae bacterium]
MSRAKLVREHAARESVISPMAEADLREIGEIERTTGLSIWGEEAYRAELEKGNSIMLVAVSAAREFDAEQQRRVSGFIVARVTADEVHINNVAVREGARGQGLGSLLLAAALDQAKRARAQMAVLEVRASNRAAQMLYVKHNFVVAGRRRNYYKTPPEDALVMTAAL